MKVDFCNWQEFLDPKADFGENLDAVAFLSWGDFPKIDPAFFEKRIKNLFVKGVFYFLSYGTEDEDIHDAIDWIVVEEDVSLGNQWKVMTTWHPKESPEDFIFFLNHCTMLDARKAKNFLIVKSKDKGKTETVLNELNKIKPQNTSH